MIYQGTLEQLKSLVASLGVSCHWEDKGSFEMAIFDDIDTNLRLNWWPETGRLEVIGEASHRLPLVAKLDELLGK